MSVQLKYRQQGALCQGLVSVFVERFPFLVCQSEQFC
jgi:hypothetical protein